MHTIIVIAAGLALLGLFLLGGRLLGGAPASGMALAALAFVPVWLLGAAWNLWHGVRYAGYTVKEELPIFLLVFALPAALAVFLWWRCTRA